MVILPFFHRIQLAFKKPMTVRPTSPVARVPGDEDYPAFRHAVPIFLEPNLPSVWCSIFRRGGVFFGQEPPRLLQVPGQPTGKQ